MEDWLKQVKEDWNKTSDSEWYKSLRTDEKIEELTRQSSESLHSINDWESNPMAALPAWITIVSQKQHFFPFRFNKSFMRRYKRAGENPALL